MKKGNNIKKSIKKEDSISNKTYVWRWFLTILTACTILVGGNLFLDELLYIVLDYRKRACPVSKWVFCDTKQYIIYLTVFVFVCAIEFFVVKSMAPKYKNIVAWMALVFSPILFFLMTEFL